MRRRCTRAAALGASIALLGMLTGCAAAPRALHWGRSGIEQDVPIALYPRIWMGLTLDNHSDKPITLRSVTPTSLRNLRAGHAFVVELQPGGFINWYDPPGTDVMQAEVAHRLPLAGFTVPPHTIDRYQVVIPLTARSTTRTASTTGATATYTSDGHTWQETFTEHDALKK